MLIFKILSYLSHGKIRKPKYCSSILKGSEKENASEFFEISPEIQAWC